jgi:hypothetical protein
MTSLVIWLRFFLFAKPNIFLLLARSKLVFYVASINISLKLLNTFLNRNKSLLIV